MNGKTPWDLGNRKIAQLRRKFCFLFYFKIHKVKMMNTYFYVGANEMAYTMTKHETS